MLLGLIVLSAPVSGLHLVPTPNTVSLRAGAFRLGAHVPLVVARKSDDEDSFAAEQLIDEAPTSFGWGKRGAAKVVVGRIGRDALVNRELRAHKVSLPANAGPDGYALIVRPNKVVCAGNSAAGTYYAVQTLKQLVRTHTSAGAVPSVDILDWPAMKIRGWQDDISRGPIPTLDFLKKQVEELSSYKLNAFTLYTEHVFRLKRHPKIAPSDGITAEEVAELDKYAKKHHVQLIGNFQSFGHFANILKVPGYENLKETSDVITPAKEESYRFLKEVYGEIAPAYSSPLFNINCDETYGLGEGPAKDMVAKEGLGNVYAKHINRVSTLLKAHGKTPMMWGDIALQYPDIRKNLPKDLIVLTWGYDPRASFVDQIEPFTKIGFKFLVCPGVSCWGQTFPDLDAATTNINNFVRDGASQGALGMLNTTWDDTGENLFNNNWYSLVWGAEVSWARPGSDANSLSNGLQAFNEAFPRLFYGLSDGRLSSVFWTLSRMRKENFCMGQSDREFWRAPWQIDISSPPSPEAKRALTKVLADLNTWRATVTRNPESLDAALVAATKTAYLWSQADAMSTLSRFTGSKTDREKMGREVAESLSAQLRQLTNLYATAWREENRAWWLDQNTSRYVRAEKLVAGLDLVPIMSPPAGALAHPTTIKIEPLRSGGEVFYTLDGSQPSSSSTKYVGGVELTRSAMLNAVAVMPDGTSSPVVGGLYTLLSRPARIETQWSHYGDNTASKAFDGLDSTYFWSFGFVSAGSTFTVVLDDADMIGGIKVTTGVAEHPEDYLHSGVLEVSSDGEKWREVAMFDKGVAQCGMIGFRVKAIRVRSTKDNGNWLVIREIELKAP